MPRARSTRCGRQRDSAWNTKISSLSRSFWAAQRIFAPRNICCRCKAGGCRCRCGLTPNDLCYLQAAACLRELEDANRAKRPGYELLIKGALLRFLALLIAQGRQCLPTETADTQRLKTVLQWLSAHYAEPLRVADAAGVCSFSASHFMRWFRQMTGQSFIAFLNEYRLNTAAETLQTTDETVLTIASRCGFENLSYFNRAFKAHFGMTPRDYRKK